LSTSWILPAASHDAGAPHQSDVIVDDDEQLMYDDENSAALSQVRKRQNINDYIRDAASQSLMFLTWDLSHLFSDV
jgi:hypothetical protein